MAHSLPEESREPFSTGIPYRVKLKRPSALQGANTFLRRVFFFLENKETNKGYQLSVT